MKRAATLILAALLTLTLATGCTANTPSSTPATSAPATQTETPAASEAATATPAPAPTATAPAHLELVVSVDDIANYDDDFGKMLQEKFNVTLTAKPIESDESLGLWASAQELPDMWVSTTFEMPQTFYSWIDQSIVRDVPADMIGKYENIKRIVDSSKELNAIKDLKGGKYWYIPRRADANHSEDCIMDGARVWYREDLIKNMGLTIPTTLDEFTRFVKDASHTGKKGNPSIGILAGGGLDYYFAMYGIDPQGWVKENGKWIPGYMSDRMLEPLKQLRDLYADKTIDNEYMITDNNGLLSKWANGMGAVMIRNGADSYWFNKTHRLVAVTLDPAFDKKPYKALDMVDVMPIPTAADGKQYWMPALDSGGDMFNAKLTDDKLDRLLEIMNWTLTEEAINWNLYGEEGVTYTVNSDGTYYHIQNPDTGAPFTASDKVPSAWFVSVCNWMNFESFYNNKWAVASASDADAKADQDGLAELQKEDTHWIQEYNKAIDPDADGFMARLISTPAKDNFAGYDYGSELNLIISGKAPVEEMFVTFKQTLASKGIQTVIDEVTAEMAKAGK